MRVPAADLRRVLSEIMVRDATRGPVGVFTEVQLARIVPHLSAALLQAQPSEDVTFVSLGNQPGALALDVPRHHRPALL